MPQVVKLPELKGHYDIAETQLVLNETIQGSKMATALFQEAMLKSDMPITFNQVSNANLVPQYEVAEPVWSQFSQRTVLKDLNLQSYVEVWPDLSVLPPREGGRARVKNKAPLIGPNNEYPAISLDENSVSLRLNKYGLRMPLTMEMIINDQLDILGKYPEAMAVFMRTLEDIVTVEALIADDGQGPRGSILGLAANAQFGTPINAALSFDSVAAGLDQLNNVEVHGVRTGWEGAKLIVPRNLELTARRIVTTPSWEFTDAQNRKYTVTNPAAGLQVVVSDALRWVNLAAAAPTTWFLSTGSVGTLGRPSLVTAFLRGYENPQTFISSPNALTPAGGLAPWTDGSFLNDSIEFKVRHFTGAKIVFAEGLLVSKGTGVA